MKLIKHILNDLTKGEKRKDKQSKGKKQKHEMFGALVKEKTNWFGFH